MIGRVLAVILALIGIGSFLFHTFAQTWAGLADVLPILMFILVYIYVATRDYFDASRGVSWLAVVGFFPFATGIGWMISDWEFLGSTRGYVPVPILILIYAYLLRRKLPDVEHGCGHFGGLDGRALGGSTAVPYAPHGHPFSVAYFERDDVGVDD